MKVFVLPVICLFSFSTAAFGESVKVVTLEESNRIEKIEACENAATKETRYRDDRIDRTVLRICMKSNADVERIRICAKVGTRLDTPIFASGAFEMMKDVFEACLQSQASENVLEACKEATTPASGYPSIYFEEFAMCIK